MKGFVKLYRSKELEEILEYYPGAFLLLTLIAIRARRTDDRLNPLGLEVGEALVGDYAAVGMKRQAYRTALEKLESLGLIERRGTNKGTVAKIVSSEIYDINAEPQQPAKEPTVPPAKELKKSQPASLEKATNKEEKNKRFKNEEERIAITKIIAYLNEKTGKSYRANTKKYVETIRARIREGYILQDFFRVVNLKVPKWKDDEKMKDYLRPETLFAESHFESYRNEEKPTTGPEIITDVLKLRKLMGTDIHAYNDNMQRLFAAGFRAVYKKGAGDRLVLFYYADTTKPAIVQRATNAGYSVVKNHEGKIIKFIQK